MSFALITRDKPDALQIRKETREAHLEYISATGVVLMAATGCVAAQRIILGDLFRGEQGRHL